MRLFCDFQTLCCALLPLRPFDIFRLAECHFSAVGNEIAIPFKCKNVDLTLSKEEEELFEVIKKS